MGANSLVNLKPLCTYAFVAFRRGSVDRYILNSLILIATWFLAGYDGVATVFDQVGYGQSQHFTSSGRPIHLGSMSIS